MHFEIIWNLIRTLFVAWKWCHVDFCANVCAFWLFWNGLPCELDCSHVLIPFSERSPIVFSWMKKCGQKRIVISVPIFGKLLLLIVSRLSLQHSGTAPQVTIHLHHFLFDTNQCRGFRMFLKLELSAFRLAGLAGLGLLSLFRFHFFKIITWRIVRLSLKQMFEL